MAEGKTRDIPVLMYHALEDESRPAGAKDAGEQLYVLQVTKFHEQMEYLYRGGYRSFLLDELNVLEEWPDKAVVLTFDDGHESNFIFALPILQQYGFKAEFFITTGWIGTPHFMSEEQIRGLHYAGMVIGSHGVTHRYLSDLSETDLISELKESKLVLEACIGVPIRSMSYPGGRMNKRTQSIAHAIGYNIICSSIPDCHRLTTDHVPVNRFAVTANMALDTFASQLHGQGLNVLRFRHMLLAITKAVLGNNLYMRLRTALIRSN